MSLTTGPTAPSVVTFRDANEPRALTARMIAVAHRHPTGWTVKTSDGSNIEALSFDAAADAVAVATGVRHLLILWAVR